MSSNAERARALVGELAREPARLVARRPTATYRLQLTPQFTFDDAAQVVPYLHALGISDVYLSPILQAAPGSTHGYDVVDHGHLNAELGGEEGYRRLCAALREHGMGQVLDFVPNHMGIGPQNPWWVDVLENGPSSVHAAYFDVDWRPVKDELANKVLVPVLGDQYGVVLERGELKLEREGGSFHLRYWESTFPLAPGRFAGVLRRGREELARELGERHPDLMELDSIITQIDKLPSRNETEPAQVTERAREKEVAKRRLAALCEGSERIRRYVDDSVAQLNGRPGEPRSFDALHQLIDNQAYRLAYWRVAGEEINYRRFFDINSLAAIRVEDERVFTDAHRLVLGLLGEGCLSGLRIDHPDGLFDPTTYFRRLQVAYLVERCRRLAVERGEAPAQGDWELESEARREVEGAIDDGRLPARPLYVVAEKILAGRERITEGWLIDGTTGYDFLVASTGVLIDRAAQKDFDALYEHFVGSRRDFADICYRQKRLIMGSSMASEINMLGMRLNRISEGNRRTRDFTLNELTRALVEFVACFPVYRTYIRGPDASSIEEGDRRYVEQTIAKAKRRARELNSSVFDFLRDVLLLRYPETLPDDQRASWLEFTLKLQQATGPVTAKAVEDTAFYNYQRLVALNEVGGSPEHFGTTPDEFHALCLLRQARWPGTLNSTSTHDTKRSEDVRARLAALSEIPDEWQAQVGRWAALNQRLLVEVDGELAPDRDDELLIYQTVLGALPIEGPGSEAWDGFPARLGTYLEKALREGKVRSSWTNPNTEYEAAAKRFAEELLRSKEFLETLLPFARRLAEAGWLGSLAQVALKCFAPGIPDVYQGCELWDLSLVDPDNRRPVDYGLRARLLRDLAERPPDEAARASEMASPENLADGRAKLLLLREALLFRRDRPDLFHGGSYEPLEMEGTHAAHVLGFARRLGNEAALCVVPRLTLQLPRSASGAIAWEGAVRLPDGLAHPLVDLITGARFEPGEAVPLEQLLSAFPVALLRSTTGAEDTQPVGPSSYAV